MSLVTLNSPKGSTLRKVAAPVTDLEVEVEPFLEEALKIVRRERGIGLAAPQMGVPFQWYIDQRGVPYINPEIVDHKDEIKDFVEGCLSLPERWYATKRYEIITLEYTDMEGNIQKVMFNGMNAYIAQHEIDHLNGILISAHGERKYADDLKKKVRK